MKKILTLMVAGVVLASTGNAWAHENCYRFDRHGGRRYHRGLQVYYTVAPVRYQEVACAVPGNTVVINVANPNGSYTPVTLRQEGGTYVGPRGERYLHMPTEEQLREVYGLK